MPSIQQRFRKSQLVEKVTHTLQGFCSSICEDGVEIRLGKVLTDKDLLRLFVLLCVSALTCIFSQWDDFAFSMIR